MTVYKPNFQQVNHDAVLSKAHKSQLGDAELFALMFNTTIKYDVDEQAWVIWNGSNWTEDKPGQLWNLIGNQLSGRYLEAAGVERGLIVSPGDAHNQNADLLTACSHALMTRKYARDVIAYAQNQPSLCVDNGIWDSDPMKLACTNGVINLATGAFRPGLPCDYIRTVIPTEYKGLNEPAPRFEQFLAEIFDNDTELIAFIKRLFGYGITGYSNEAVIPFLVGAGRNGKDTLMQAIENVLGLDVSGPVSSSILLGGKQNPDAATPYIFNLRFKRIAYINETNDGATLNSGQVKWLTGASTLTGRLLHGNPVTFKPQHLLVLLTNHKPHAPADDFALWKRLLLIPFNLSFVENPQAPNERSVDKKLVEKLKAESPGILSWLVKGCLEWQSKGLNVPKSIQQITEQYREDEDILRDFVSECCKVEEGREIKSSVLYATYQEWAKSNGYKPLGNKRFSQKMELRFEKKPKGDGNYFIGVDTPTLEEEMMS